MTNAANLIIIIIIIIIIIEREAGFALSQSSFKARPKEKRGIIDNMRSNKIKELARPWN